MVSKTKGWAKMHWDIFEDENLSWQEATMCCYLADIYETLKKKKVVDGKEYRRLSDTFIQNMFSNPNSKDGCISVPTIRTYLNRLKEEGYIEMLPESQKIGRYYRMTDEYTDVFSVGNSDVNTVGNSVESTVGNTVGKNLQQNILTDYQTKQTITLINSEEKNKSKEVTKVSKEVYDYFNQTLGTNYKYNVKGNKDRVKKLLDSGYTLEDIKTVIDKKTKQWKNDPKMKQFLTPTTLLGDKFDTYLNQEVYVKPESKLSSMSYKEWAKDLGTPI